MARRYWNDSVETMSPNDIARLQDAALRAALPRVVAASPFYAERYREMGLDPEAVRGVADLARLPFTEKGDMRDSQIAAPPLGRYAGVDMVDVVRVHASSGTTGRPSYVGVTESDAAGWAEVAARVYFCEGMRRDDVVLHGFGLGFFVGGLPLAEAVRRIGATFIPLGTGASDRLVAAADDLGATVLSCTPSYARYLAELMRTKFDRDPRTLGVRLVLVGAEPGGGIPAVRARIAADFGAEVRESVGNADIFPMYAGTCEAQGGNHLQAPDHVVFELIDPDSGDVLDWTDGAEGELVATHLQRECASLIRFRTRDRVVVATSPCPCGRTGPRIRCVGRTDDLLIVNGVNVWPSAVSDVVSAVPGTTGALEIVIPGPPPAVSPPLHIRVEHTGPAGDLEALRGTIERQIRDTLHARAAVELLPAGTLPRTEAKSRLVRVETAAAV
jgi:phenylacetate-CoA ligase